jgi:hypothetical protein
VLKTFQHSEITIKQPKNSPLKKQISLAILLTFYTHLVAEAGIQYVNKTTLVITNIQELSLHRQAPSSINQLIEN